MQSIRPLSAICIIRTIQRLPSKLHARFGSQHTHIVAQSTTTSDLPSNGSQPLLLKDQASIRHFVQLLSDSQRAQLLSELRRSNLMAQNGTQSVTSLAPLPYTGSIDRDQELDCEDSMSTNHDTVSTTVTPSTRKHVVLIESPSSLKQNWLIEAIDPSSSFASSSSSSSSSSDASSSSSITAAQYRQVFLHQALPFVGFGFLDNLIMILAGDYIDATLGVTLGISTMAAAGLGNAISDVAGIGSAWYVESICSKIGIDSPNLNAEQEQCRSVRYTIQSGRVVGIVVGCLIGMFPLLITPNKRSANEDDDHVGLNQADNLTCDSVKPSSA